MRHQGIHIWNINLDQQSLHTGSDRILAAVERDRAHMFHSDIHRNRYIAGRIALRIIVGRYLRKAPAEVQFKTGRFGKPFVLGSALRFNLSHSENRALLALAWNREIGVDIERMRQTRDLAELARFSFAPREYATFLFAPVEQQPSVFYHFWTWKEAYIKARGEGMSMPLDSFVVPFKAHGGPSICALESSVHGRAEIDRWQFCSLDGGPGFAAAIAVERGAMNVQSFQF